MNQRERLEFWIANLKSAREMWLSIPPENVYPKLLNWRLKKRGRSQAHRLDCNTVACFGGWCAWWPPFRALGVRPNCFGMPIVPDRLSASTYLFGEPLAFAPRYSANPSMPDDPTDSDHAHVLKRIDWMLDRRKSDLRRLQPEAH